MKRRNRVLQERGTIYKKSGVRLSMALVYPNTYGLGMANLGFQTVYRLFNEIENVRCERVFLPQKYAHLRSVESGRRLNEFDVIAFSLSFELDYLNVAHVLMLAGLPLRSEDRDETSPLVMAGGVGVTLNPEPLAPLMDLFVIGESETIIPLLADSLVSHHRRRFSRQETLLALTQISGVYVPRFYNIGYSWDGRVSKIEPAHDVPPRVQRQYVNDIDSVQTFSPIVSTESHFKEMFLVEVGRGCPRGCRFCASGFIYRPVRYRHREGLLSQIHNRKDGTKRIGLVGSAVSDHPQFEVLCKELVNDGFQLGVSSFRADALTSSFINILVQGGVRTLTLAPETGSEQLRTRIHKNLTDEDILNAVRVAAEGGMSNIKLYFIVGFPFEDEDETASILSLVKGIRSVFFSRKRTKGRVAVSIHPFVPKASTPFQWIPMENVKLLAQKLEKIAAGLREISGVYVSPKSPRRAFLQGLFSVGDRRVGEAICLKTEDRLHWKRAWKKAGVKPEWYVYREKAYDEILPWEVIDSGIDKRTLWGQYQRAKKSVFE